MHHPGPPRFTSVGESVELAPRNPGQGVDGGDGGAPADRFRWELVDAPTDSEADLDPGQGTGAVVHLAPDEPGCYVAALDAPDGRHEQTVRAFPEDRHEATFRVPDDAIDGDGDADADGFDRVSVLGPFNEYRMGTHRAERRDGAWTLDVELPPGDHHAVFAFDDGFDPYARAEVTVEGPGRPRLRLDGRVEDDELVVRSAARAPPDGETDPRVEFHLDGRDGLDRTDVTVEGDELRVSVGTLREAAGRRSDDRGGDEGSDGRDPVRVHAVPVAERHGVADTLRIEVGGGTGAAGDLGADIEAETDEDGEPDGGDGGDAGAVTVTRPADPPAWVHDATIYQIFVREFAGETVDTTFAEIERRVEYVDSLGVDTVWLTPIVASPTRHGYHITDLFETAEDLGSRAAFESMVERFHEAGIRVLFDLVINHTSRDHPVFQLHRADVEGYEDHYERVPPERDATDVHWAGDDAPGVYFNWASIPNLNYDSLDVRAWMLDVIDEWAPLVDGFRCDVAWGVPHGFWKEVRERVTAEDSAFLLLDETVPRDVGFHENEFGMHYDTDLYYALRDVGTGDAPATDLLDAVAASERRGFPDAAAHMRYVENHDEERYATECGTGTLRPAAAATLTLPGTPMIYYGQERGVPEQRGTMRWHDGDAALADWHRRLVELRNALPTLRAPGVDPVGHEVVSGDPDRVVAYARSGDGDGDRRRNGTGDDRPAVVVLNFAADPATVRLDRSVGTTNLVDGTDAHADDGGATDERAAANDDGIDGGTTVRVPSAVVLRSR